MKKFRSFLSVVLSSLFFCFAIVNCAVFSSAAASPVIGIRYISPYGTTNGYLVGCVFKEDHTDFDYNDYYIKAYLQTVKNGPYYVKPYGDRQITELSPDGTFQVDVTTGGVDEYAIAFRVELYSSDSGTVIDTVYISRPDGKITISPTRKLPPADTGMPSNLSITDDKIGLCVGLYTQPGMNPNYNTPLTEEHIREQLTALLPFTDTVRFYGVDTETQKAYRIAQELGFNIIACACLGYSQSSNAAEIEALIDICNTYPNVRVALVGNESLLTNKVSTEYLVNQIQYVRNNIPEGEGIAVSTADTVDTYFENSRLRSVVDLYYVHIYSYWSVGSKDASYTINRIEEFNEAFCKPDGKEIIIGETGLPVNQELQVNVALDEESAVNYFTDMKSFCLRNNIKLMYFEAFDEPWKSLSEGSVGGHWGLFSDGVLKSGYAELDFFKTAYREFMENHILPSINVYTEEGIIFGFNSDLSMSDLHLQKFIHTKNKCINVACNTDRIGTDSVMTFTVSGKVIAETRAVIFGDVNGDGWYDGTDSVIVNCLADGLLSREHVSEAVYMAADCNHDGVIDGADVALLEQAGIILAAVDQSKSPEELMTDSAYVEYLNLIKQSPTDEPVAECTHADGTPTDEPADEDNPADAALTEEPADEGFNTSFIERLIDFISYIAALIVSFFTGF